MTERNLTCARPEYISVVGARENNLKDVSVDIPKRKLTVFTGVSGAGKSSLVFDTIAAEAQRQLNDTFRPFVRNRLPTYGQPEADELRNLSTAIIMDQQRIHGNARSTVGTYTDIHSFLRLLYSRFGTPSVGYSNAFSFNDPDGMCTECDGLGKAQSLDLNAFLDTSKSLNEGAINFSQFAVGKYQWKIYTNSGLFDNDKKLKEYTEDEWDTLLYGTDTTVEFSTKGGTTERDYEGLVEKFRRLYINRDINDLSETLQEEVAQLVSQSECPVCDGARLNQDALRSRIDGYNIADLSEMPVAELRQVLEALEEPDANPLVDAIVSRLTHLESVGLGYLTLNRETETLSGGESQRLKIVKQLGSGLTGLIYIFDEPTVGLHSHDVGDLVELLYELRDDGNTVLVVEHDPTVVNAADHIVDLGPGAGQNGGKILHEGSIEGLQRTDTPTGNELRKTRSIKSSFRSPTGQLPIEHATRNNLQDITVTIPREVLSVVTGVSGAGKSSLIETFREQHDDTVYIDQDAISTSIRSVPATYSGMMDSIREKFSRANEVSTSLFSFNSTGGCPACDGRGFTYTDMAFLDPIESTCEVCDGTRYSDEALEYRLRGRTIAAVMAMTVSEAAAFFEDPTIQETLTTLEEVGLGYLPLGQSLTSLSGGERQRIKLASELGNSDGVYILDEPTVGLHMADIDQLITVLDTLVEDGNTVIVIEHNLDIVKQADWVIDLGPGGGIRGGEVIFEGTPERLAESDDSLTGEYLRQSL